MARAPNEKVKEAYELYKKGYKLVEISKKLDVPDGTVRRWKKTYSWDNERSENKSERSQKNDKKTKSKGGQLKNKNAEKFGFFSRYLPEETQELIGAIFEKNQLDILWEQITIQYAAIIRAQKIMYVRDKDDMARELKKIKSSENGEETEYELQFAWDRNATFLNAQSRAMSELRNLIKQYDSMVNNNLELVTEEQRLRIEKLKAEVGKLSNKQDNDITIKVVRASEKHGRS
ncbi:phage terminase small subunit [Romboutsia timonensis]|uniref:phage terminase small subunit n=1 Tax=Romboutsia timonensis TaxID=1776391 RepID=UPI0008D9B318|nr:phage terminase small subunit [Romboutsia timonensis]